MKGEIVQTPAERFAHGTRSRYVKGCRCAPCRESNRLYYHQRQAVIRERVAELEQRQRESEAVLGPAPIAAAPQVWTAPDGSQQVRIYARACPGYGGPCPTRSHLRKDSKGGLCEGCRKRLAFNGIVSAERARAHLVELSKAGVGRRAVAAACDVGESAIAAIAAGEQTQLRAETERRILAVDAGAAADHAVVRGAPTWAAIRELRRLGWSKARISRAIGNNGLALQIRKRRVLARTALAVAQLLERERALRHSMHRCVRCGQSHMDDREAAEWCFNNRHVPVDPLELAG